MKHIAIIITFGALLVGCSENRNKSVSAKNNQTIAPMASVQKSVAAVPEKTKQVHRHAKRRLNSHTLIKNDKVTSGQAAPLVTSKKKPLRAMTFNEAQFSDKASTFPRTSEALNLEEEKYND